MIYKVTVREEETKYCNREFRRAEMWKKLRVRDSFGTSHQVTGSEGDSHRSVVTF